MSDCEQKRREDSELLKECYQGDIWTFVADTRNYYLNLKARCEQLQDSLDSLQSCSKRKELNPDVNFVSSLSPCESELVEEIEADLPCFNDEMTHKRQRNNQIMDIQSPDLGETERTTAERW